MAESDANDDMPLGSVLDAHDNGTFMLSGDMPHPVCPSCGFLTQTDWVDPAYRVSTTLDVSATYDGYTIVSHRFADFIRPHGGRLIDLISAPGHSALTSDEVIPFDPIRRRTMFRRFCPTCDRYDEVIGATPAQLANNVVVPNRIVRSDLEFGAGDRKQPLLMVGNDLAAAISNAGFTGLHLEPIPRHIHFKRPSP